MFYKIASVKALPDFMLEITFTNQEVKYYDLKPLSQKWPAFENLKNTLGLFEQVKVDAGGYGIFWNDEIDLTCNELYFHSKT